MHAVRRAIGLFLVAATGLLAGCQDYTVPLPHGYFIARVHSGGFGIVTPQNRGVTRLTTRGVDVAVVGDIVAGEIDPEWSKGEKPLPNEDFFVIHTATGQAWLDLQSGEYRQRLRELGVGAPPNLHRVGRFSAFLRTAV